MPSKEVTALRKNGHLEEALRVAQADLRIERNEYSLSALFWVYRDMAIKEFEQKNKQGANDCLIEAKALSKEPELVYDEYVQNAISSLMRRLSPNFGVVEQASEQSKQGDVKGAYDKIKELLTQTTLNDSLHESYGWIIYRYLNNEYKNLGSIPCRRILAEYMNLHNERPSLLHSNMLNLASKVSETYSDFNFLEFIKLWGAENFMYDDFRSTYYQGKDYPPLTSRLMERCFRMNYGLEDVIQAFTANSKIKESDVLEAFSKNRYFDIYRESTANGAGLLQMFKSYCLAIEGRTIQNPYHSKILKSMVWEVKPENNEDFLKLFDQWGERNLMLVDWKKETTEDGKEYPSLAEKAISKYIDILKTTNRFSNATDEFVNLLKDAVTKLSENDQYKRYLAKLLFVKGNVEEARDIYKELLLSLNDYYVWGELSEMVVDKMLAKSAICKALSRGSSDDYLGNLHLRLADILIEEINYSAALTELKAYYSTYTRKQWNIDEEYHVLMRRIPQGITASEDNRELYEQHKQLIEDYVYSDIEAQEFVVAELYKNNKQKQRALFVDGNISFSVNPESFSELKNCHVGQAYWVKINKTEMEGQQIIPLQFRASNSNDWNPLPEKVGFVEYINESKRICHLITCDSQQVFFVLESQEYCIGDYFSFKQYKKDTKDGERIEIVDVRPIDKEDAIIQFPHRIVAVDDINETKQLFHFVFGPRLVSGIVHYNETSVRPSVGDCLEMYYCIRKNKEQKKIVVPILINETEEVNEACIKSVSGELRITYKSDGSRFGFVEDCYVHNSLLEKYDIQEDCYVDAKIVYTGAGKWKVFELERK